MQSEEPLNLSDTQHQQEMPKENPLLVEIEREVTTPAGEFEKNKRRYWTPKEEERFYEIWGRENFRLTRHGKNMVFFASWSEELRDRYNIDVKPEEVQAKVNQMRAKFRSVEKQLRADSTVTVWKKYNLIDKILRNEFRGPDAEPLEALPVSTEVQSNRDISPAPPPELQDLRRAAAASSNSNSADDAYTAQQQLQQQSQGSPEPHQESHPEQQPPIYEAVANERNINIQPNENDMASINMAMPEILSHAGDSSAICISYSTELFNDQPDALHDAGEQQHHRNQSHMNHMTVKKEFLTQEDEQYERAYQAQLNQQRERLESQQPQHMHLIQQQETQSRHQQQQLQLQTPPPVSHDTQANVKIEPPQQQLDTSFIVHNSNHNVNNNLNNGTPTLPAKNNNRRRAPRVSQPRKRRSAVSNTSPALALNNNSNNSLQLTPAGTTTAAIYVNNTTASPAMADSLQTLYIAELRKKNAILMEQKEIAAKRLRVEERKVALMEHFFPKCLELHEQIMQKLQK